MNSSHVFISQVAYLIVACGVYEPIACSKLETLDF